MLTAQSVIYLHFPHFTDSHKFVRRTHQPRLSPLQKVISFFTNGAKAIYPRNTGAHSRHINSRKGLPNRLKGTHAYQTQFDDVPDINPHRTGHMMHHAGPHQIYDSASNSHFNADDWQPIKAGRSKRQAEQFQNRGRPRCRAFQSRRCG